MCNEGHASASGANMIVEHYLSPAAEVGRLWFLDQQNRGDTLVVRRALPLLGSDQRGGRECSEPHFW